MKRLLFNATHAEELRLVVIDGQHLLDLDIESAGYEQKKGNVYKAKVTRVEPSLEAAFVDYGTERQGFLPLKEISRIYFQGVAPNAPMAQVRIQDVIKEGQELIVQVDKEERGTKGAALTTFVSLAGRFLVLMPNNPKGGGISRRIEGEERAELRESMAGLEVPPDCALIARTAGIGKSSEELQWDLDYLIHLWDAISKAAVDRSAPFLIYQESNLVVRAIRDYLRSDIGEVIVDNAEIYERMRKFMEQVSPHSLHKLKLYEEEMPLYARYQVEHQIDSAFSREVRLESGGSVVFDHTEALVSVDVNSSKATKGADIEETALMTNLEAADEVARQLRLRDFGGLIVIDFIDMTPTRNQREVENRLSEALKADRARVQVGRISRFGLLEMSRQRLRPSLGEASTKICPRCVGTGHIRSVPSSALHILRLIQDEAMKENSAKVHVHLPIETATYLLNEKRRELNLLESKIGTPIIIIPSADMETPHFGIRRLRSEEVDEEPDVPSYQINQQEPAEEDESAPGLAEKPLVGQLTYSGAAPPPPKKPGSGFFAWLKNLFVGKAKPKKKSQARKRYAGRGRTQQQRRRGPQKQAARGQQRGGQQRGQQQRGGQQQAPDDTDKADKPQRSEAGRGDEEKRQSRGRRNRPNRGQPNRNQPRGDRDQSEQKNRRNENRNHSETAQAPKEVNGNVKSKEVDGNVKSGSEGRPTKPVEAKSSEKADQAVASTPVKDNASSAASAPPVEASSAAPQATESSSSKLQQIETKPAQEKEAKAEESSPSD